MPDAKSALEGARDILVERFAETAELLAKLRTRLWDQGVVTSTVMKGKKRPRKKNSEIIMPILKLSAPSLRIARWRCSVAARWVC